MQLELASNDRSKWWFKGQLEQEILDIPEQYEKSNGANCIKREQLKNICYYCSVEWAPMITHFTADFWRWVEERSDV